MLVWYEHTVGGKRGLFALNESEQLVFQSCTQ
jgi:hypothetical protein